MPSSFQHLLFDLDGTLSNPQEGIYNGFRHALQKMNVPYPENFEWQRCIGPPLQDSFRRYFFGEDSAVDEAVRFFRQYYSERGWHENQIYEGIPELCRDLKTSGKELYVVTNKPTLFAEKILAHFRIEKYFTEISGQPMNSRCEKSDLITNLLQRTGAAPHSTMLIGDTHWDIEAARISGITSFGVTYGFEAKEELLSHHPDFSAGSISGLRQQLIR